MPQTIIPGNLWSDVQNYLSLGNQNINAGASNSLGVIGAVRFRVNWIHFTVSAAGKIRVRVDALPIIELFVPANTPVLCYFGEFGLVHFSSPGEMFFTNDSAAAMSVNLKGAYQLRA